jgi:hypothetical protein
MEQRRAFGGMSHLEPDTSGSGTFNQTGEQQSDRRTAQGRWKQRGFVSIIENDFDR